MTLLDISIQSRVIIGICAMTVLFTGFIIAFISNQRKKLQYHKSLQALHLEQQERLKEENFLLEQRVRERTVQLTEHAEALQKALQELRLSQARLIQKEKLASLGELTAGVAHEIQNPLNFVLNFGAVNLDLLSELKEAVSSAKVSDDSRREADVLLQDILINQQKIVQHGKRAEGIVKNMLQHARKKTGVMEATDLNELVEESRLVSYNNFRSKKKTFTCTFQNEFDPGLADVLVAAEDVGYVLTNVLNNAFYSMHEKSLKQGNGYLPSLAIGTRRAGNKVLITIRDNGTGIPSRIMDKIFQPFFTTKPTGEATGLGLSLSYDMMKAQDGELTAESNEGEYAKFTIALNC